MDAFGNVFLTRRPFASRHDAFVSVPFADPFAITATAGASTAASKLELSPAEDRERLSCLDLSPGPTLCRFLPRLLGRALGNRATGVVARYHLAPPPPPPTAASASYSYDAAGPAAVTAPGSLLGCLRWSWGLGSSAPSPVASSSSFSASHDVTRGVVVLGLDVDSSTCGRRVVAPSTGPRHPLLALFTHFHPSPFSFYCPLFACPSFVPPPPPPLLQHGGPWAQRRRRPRGSRVSGLLGR